MYSLVDNLIFPAPKASYDYASLKGRILFVPKFESYKPQYNFPKRESGANTHQSATTRKNEDFARLQKIRRNSIFIRNKQGSSGYLRCGGRNHTNSQLQLRTTRIGQNTRHQSTTPVRQLDFNRASMFTHTGPNGGAISRDVSLQASHLQQRDQFNDTIPQFNNLNRCYNDGVYRNTTKKQNEAVQKEINKVSITQSGKLDSLPLQNVGPSHMRGQSDFKMRNAKGGTPGLGRLQRSDDSEAAFENTEELSMGRGRVQVANGPSPRFIDEPESTVLSSSSVETVKQENKIGLNVKNKSDLKNIKDGNMTSLKNINKMYTDQRNQEIPSGASTRNRKNTCLSQRVIDPGFREIDAQMILPEENPLISNFGKNIVRTSKVGPDENPKNRTQPFMNLKSKVKVGFQQTKKFPLRFQNKNMNWIKKQNQQSLNELSNSMQAQLQTTQNRSKEDKQQESGYPLIASFEDRTGVVNEMMEDLEDHNVNDFSEDEHENSFQEFGCLEELERDDYDALSASEPYTTLMYKKQKLQMPLYSPNKPQIQPDVQKQRFHDNLSLIDEHQKLIKQQKDYLKVCKSDYIPCIFFPGNSDKVLLHFHANGEDMGQTQPLMRKINQKLGFNIMCMEYPGYGLYVEGDGLTQKQSRSKQIQKDAETVFQFIRDRCNVPESNILLMGRSIGSGPACHLASQYLKARGLILVSPIKSVKEVAKQNYGRIVDLLIEERFNNFEVARKIRCPVLVYHGLKDTMVPYQHSIEMLIDGFTQCKAHMFLRQDMEHNKFDYINDIIRPMKYFLRINKILNTRKKKILTAREVVNLRKEGYVDKKAQQFFYHLGIVSKSHYFNNYQASFKPEVPQKNSKGIYLKETLPKSSTNLVFDENQMPVPIHAGEERESQEDIGSASPTNKFQKPQAMNFNERILPGRPQRPTSPLTDQPPANIGQDPYKREQQELSKQLNELQKKFNAQFNQLGHQNMGYMQKRSSEMVQQKVQQRIGTQNDPKGAELVEDSQRVDTCEEDVVQVTTDANKQEAKNNEELQNQYQSLEVQIMEAGGLSKLEKKQIRKLLKESIKQSFQSISCQSQDSFLTSSVVINDEFKATFEGRELEKRMKEQNKQTPLNDMSKLNKQLKAVDVEVEEHDVDFPPSFIQVEGSMQNHIITVPKSKLQSLKQYERNNSPGQLDEHDDAESDKSGANLDQEMDTSVKKIVDHLKTPFKNQNQNNQQYNQQNQDNNSKSEATTLLGDNSIRTHPNNGQPLTLDFSQFSQQQFKIDDLFFKQPLDQIKDEKNMVEGWLQQVKEEQNKYKDVKKTMKPSINKSGRFNVSQDQILEKFQPSESQYTSIKSHRVAHPNAPNKGGGTARDHFVVVNDLTDRGGRNKQRTMTGKHIQPKEWNQSDLEPVESFKYEVPTGSGSNPKNKRNQDSMVENSSDDESHRRDYPQIKKKPLNSSSMAVNDSSSNLQRSMKTTRPIHEQKPLELRHTHDDIDKEKIMPPQATSMHQAKMNLKNRHKQYQQEQGEQSAERRPSRERQSSMLKKQESLWQIMKQNKQMKSKKHFQDLTNNNSSKASLKLKESKKKLNQKSAAIIAETPKPTHPNSSSSLNPMKVNKSQLNYTQSVNEFQVVSPLSKPQHPSDKMSNLHHKQQSLSTYSQGLHTEASLQTMRLGNKMQPQVDKNDQSHHRQSLKDQQDRKKSAFPKPDIGNFNKTQTTDPLSRGKQSLTPVKQLSKELKMNQNNRNSQKRQTNNLQVKKMKSTSKMSNNEPNSQNHIRSRLRMFKQKFGAQANESSNTTLGKAKDGKKNKGFAGSATQVLETKNRLIEPPSSTDELSRNELQQKLSVQATSISSQSLLKDSAVNSFDLKEKYARPAQLINTINDGIHKKTINLKSERTASSNPRKPIPPHRMRVSRAQGQITASSKNLKSQEMLIQDDSVQHRFPHDVDPEYTGGSSLSLKDRHTEEHDHPQQDQDDDNPFQPNQQAVNSPEVKMFQKYFEKTRRNKDRNKQAHPTSTNTKSSKQQMKNNSYVRLAEQQAQKQRSKTNKLVTLSSTQRSQISVNNVQSFQSPTNNMTLRSPRLYTNKAGAVGERSLSQLSDNEIEKRILSNRQKMTTLQKTRTAKTFKGLSNK